MKTSLHIFTSLIAFSIITLAYGQVPQIRFVMGEYKPTKHQNEVSFRCSPELWKPIGLYRGFNLIYVSWPKGMDTEPIWEPETTVSFGIDKVGMINDNYSNNGFELSIDSAYWKNSISTQNLISLGDLRLEKDDQKRVKWLQYYPTLGEINSIASYPNLEYLIIPKCYHENPILFHPDFYLNHFYSNYGVPLFSFDILKKINTLKYLDIDGSKTFSSDVNERYRDNRNELNLLSGVPNGVIDLPKLSMLKLNGCDFLPVHFHKMEKFTYLDINLGLYSKPELINLALIMNHSGKDTSSGNWSDFLQLGKVDGRFNIPVNGVYESFYKNGQPLCKGTFVNGLPDGEWIFWFENGLLSQKRIYSSGQKNGEWVFLSSRVNLIEGNDRDTVHSMNFRNDTLLERTDIDYESFWECQDYHGPYYMSKKVTSRYKFTYDENALSQITHHYLVEGQKVAQGSNSYMKETDTLNGFNETWNLTDSMWLYNFSDFHYICYREGDHDVRFSASGKMGQLANYSIRKSKSDWSIKDQYLIVNEVDLEAGIARNIKYEWTNVYDNYLEIDRVEIDLSKLLSTMNSWNKK